MKSWLLVLGCIGAFLWPAPSRAAVIRFPLVDLTGSPAARQITLTPQTTVTQVGTNIAVGPNVIVPATNGTPEAQLVAGRWRVSFEGLATTFSLNIPDTNATYLATDPAVVGSLTTYTYTNSLGLLANSTNYYTRPEVDALVSTNGGGGGSVPANVVTNHQTGVTLGGTFSGSLGGAGDGDFIRFLTNSANDLFLFWDGTSSYWNLSHGVSSPYFFGDGNGVTNVPAGNLTGTLLDARLSTNVLKSAINLLTAKPSVVGYDLRWNGDYGIVLGRGTTNQVVLYDYSGAGYDMLEITNGTINFYTNWGMPRAFTLRDLVPVANSDGSSLTNNSPYAGYPGGSKAPPVVVNNFYNSTNAATQSSITFLLDWMAARDMLRGYTNNGVRPYFMVDDGWSAATRTNGMPIGWNANFPQGMAWLAAAIRTNGMEPGIYTSWSPQTCYGFAGTPDAAAAWLDLPQFSAWGYTMAKVDDCAAPAPYNYYGYSLHKLRILNSVVQGLTNTMILDANAPCYPPPDWVGSMASVFGDFSSRGQDYLNAATVSNVLSTAVTPLFYPKLTGDGHFFRLYGIGAAASPPDYRVLQAALTLNAIIPACEQLDPGLQSVNSPYSVITNKLRLQIHQTTPVYPGTLASSNSTSQIIVRPLNARQDRWAVALFNTSLTSNQSLTITPAMLQSTNQSLSVWDCYGGTNAGNYTAAWTYYVPTNDSALLLVTLSPILSTTNLVGTFPSTNLSGTNLIVTPLATTIQAGAPNTLVVTNGRVGVGTAAPGYVFTVAGGNAQFSNDILMGGFNLNSGRCYDSWGPRWDLDTTHPFKLPAASLLIGYIAAGENWGTTNIFCAGRILIGTTNASTERLEIVGGGIRVSGSITATNCLYLPSQATAPAILGAGAAIWSDGTNLLVILQNAGGVKTTNKATLTPYP